MIRHMKMSSTIFGMIYNMKKFDVKVGDRVIVSGRREKAIVTAIEWLESESRHVLRLDWGEFGTSRVYENDQGSVWNLYNSLN